MKFEQVRLLLNDDRLEATLEYMTRALVSPVEVLGIARVERVHPTRKRRAGCFHQEVVVVAHQAIGVEKPGLVGDDRREKVQEMAAIAYVAKDRPPLVAAAGDVVQRSWELQAEGSRHVYSLL
jgi:hypothetical protein